MNLHRQYEYADKLLKSLFVRIQRAFSKAKDHFSFDDQNVIEYAKVMYDRMDREARTLYLKVATKAYTQWLDELENAKADYDLITTGWVNKFLAKANPVSTFIYDHEVERKRMRFAEAVMSTSDSGKSAKEIETSRNAWSRMVRQYADELVDEGTLEAFRQSNIKKVRWIAELDPKTCKICLERHNKVYDIGKMPPKPHWNCRCVLEPVKGKGDTEDASSE